MPRALWKGALSFGLVNVPVNLYSAARSEDISFDMLDKRNFAPIGYKKVNKKTGKEVDKANIVKGYEYEKGEYVLITDEDFKQANPKATQTVEILSFIKAADLEPLYLDTPYYLEPGKRGEKGYVLLRDVLKETGRIAIGHVVIRTKEHLAAVLPVGDMLVLNTLRWHDEIRSSEDLEIPKSAGVSGRERHMAKQLVEGMEQDWKPEKFKDTYRDDLMARIKRRIKAGQIHTVPDEEEESAETPRSAEVIDLAAMLRRSLEGKGGKPDDRKEPTEKAHRRAAGHKSVSTKRVTRHHRKRAA
jgi:DNA end-binding protein Ku